MIFNFLRKFFEDKEFNILKINNEVLKLEKESYKNCFIEVSNQYMELLKRKG